MAHDKMPTLVLAGAVVVVAVVLFGVPLASLLFPLALLACPLMMIFMMRGMNHDGGRAGHGPGCHGGQQPTDETGRPKDPSTSGTDDWR
jgi:hypothetical protein